MKTNRNHNEKRVLSLILSVVLVFTSFFTPALAEELVIEEPTVSTMDVVADTAEEGTTDTDEVTDEYDLSEESGNIFDESIEEYSDTDLEGMLVSDGDNTSEESDEQSIPLNLGEEILIEDVELSADPMLAYGDGGETGDLSGSGTESNPYLIRTAAQLPTEIDADTYYALDNDITLGSGQQITTLAGVLDGKGHVITLTDQPLASTVSGTIQNLGVTGSINAAVDSSDCGGALAMTLTGVICNSYSTVSLASKGICENIGGVAGVVNGGTVKNTYYAGNITGNLVTSGMVARCTAGGTYQNCFYTTDKLSAWGTVFDNISCSKITIEELQAEAIVANLNTNITDTGYIFAYSAGNYPVLQKNEGSTGQEKNWTDLEAAIENAEALTEGDYTEESWNLVAMALETAKSVKENDNATQNDIDDAAQALNDAISALTRKPVTEPVDKPTDGEQIVRITSAADFHTYAKDLLDEKTSGKYLILENDITIDSNYGSGSGKYASFTNFSGVLDGQGHSIIFENATSSLFGGVNYGAAIQNVAFRGSLSIDAGFTKGPLGENFAGYLLNCYSDIQGTNVSGFAGKMSDGVISNCFSAGEISGGGAFVNNFTGGVVQNAYYLNTLSSTIGTSMSEDAMKTTTFVDILNTNRGNNGIRWGQSSNGYPYFGENQEYVPNTDPYPALPGESICEVGYTAHDETEQQILGEDHRLQVSPLLVGDSYFCGTLSLVDYVVPEGSEILWSVASTPSDSFAIAEETGELYVYKNGKATVTATQKNSDGTYEAVAYVAVLATTQEMTDIRLMIDDQDVTNKSYTVHGSEVKSIRVQAKFADSGESYKDVAYSGFTFEVGDEELIFSRSKSSNSFYFKKTGTSFITVTSKQNPNLSAKIDLTSEYVPVESVMPALSQDIYTIHGRNANSEGQEADGRIAYNPIHDNVIVTPSNATNADKVTVTGDNDTVAYYESGEKVYVPKEAGTVTFTASVEDQDPVTGEIHKVSGSKTVEFQYLNPVSYVEVEDNNKELTIQGGAVSELKVNVTGKKDTDGYHVTEPALKWTVDQPGIVKITSQAKGKFDRDENSPDYNKYFPEMTYTVIGLSAGTVTATGTPIDNTNKVDPVTVTITVEGTAEKTDIDNVVAEGSSNAHAYVENQYSSSGYAYGNEWLVYAQLRAGEEIDDDVLDNYYASVVAKVSTWSENQKPTDLERVALALTAMDKGITDVEGANLAAMIYNHPDLASGSNELIYALLALDAADITIPSDAKWSRSSIIAELLKFQNTECGGFGLTDNRSASVDMTAMALQGLANYKNRPEVKTAIDKALAYLKDQQREDYGYGNAESTAQVLLALSLLGIDPTDAGSGFGMANFNIITNLMEYQNEDGGFAHLMGWESESMSTAQALHALDAFQKSKAGISYWNVNGTKAEVTFLLLGDTVHDSDKDGNIHTLQYGNLQTWIPETTYRVNPGASVVEVLQMALSDNNMTCEDKYNDGSYISAITRNGVTLGEFTNGKKSGWMYTLNGVHPDLSVKQQKLKDGDAIVFHYTDNYSSEYEHVHTWDAGTVTKAPACTSAGVKTYKCSCGETKTEVLSATGHKFGSWATATAATVFAPAVQTRTCAVCGLQETRTYGSALTPAMKVTATKLPLKIKQSTSKFKVTGLASGDSVKSWKSSNTKIFKVSGKANGTCKITAGSKTGKATLTITLASGLQKKVTITVQKGTVNTTKITGLKSSLTLAKGKKTTLKPVLTPITSQQKITYSSSNKKVAVVTSKGVITAKSAGTAKITVKSGSKKYTVKVTVPKTKTTKITGIKESITVKKGKTYTLKPKLTPKASDEKVTYKSSNKKVATVTSSGKIKGIKKGTATITVKSGSVSVKCKVTVK